ncbi:hypothetical protein Hanom_Chr14g01275151 [Helianthus anomalus]
MVFLYFITDPTEYITKLKSCNLAPILTKQVEFQIYLKTPSKLLQKNSINLYPLLLKNKCRFKLC